jgi:hypothetical protein
MQKIKPEHELSKWDRHKIAKAHNDKLFKEAESITDPLPATKNPSVKIHAVVADEKLLAAKAAYDAERAEAKKPKPIKTVSAELSSADKNAIYQAWLAHSQFPVTPWNEEMLRRWMLQNVADGNISFSSAGLTKGFEYLRTNGHLENKRRLRGERAPIPYGQAVNVKTTEPKPPSVTTEPELSAEELRNMPLQDLASIVKSKYNYKRSADQVLPNGRV